MADDFELNLTNYKDRVGSRVTPGRYRVFVEDAELDSTRDNKPMINVWLRVQGGTFEGSTVIDRLLPSHEKALFRIVGFMQAIGLPTPKKRLKPSVRQFIGKSLEVDIEDGDPYNGRVKSEVRGYYRIEPGKGETGGSDLSDLMEAETAGEGTVLTELESGGVDTSKKADGRPERGAEAQDSADEVDLDQLDL